MATLSVIIVSYNVKYFLEQALQSVLRASKGLDSEIWVVDNASSDGSVAMVRERFPEIQLIANKENVGFSRANNQAIAQASGKYLLLLNPDTVVEEDTLQKCVQFMDEHPDAGGLGVKMLDGKGNFLKESKRAFPSPGVAFYKAFGLTALFPRSERFARYYLGHLDPNKTHEVEVLAGAFMMLRKKVIDEIGSLDETFFMYGEDIDLSYRIVKAGYKNYYYPETRIIHYKGESTKKSSVNYVKVFYRAMAIFYEKHFGQKKARLFSFFIHLAIWFKAALSLLSRTFQRLALPLLDGVFLYAGLLVIKNYWESQVKNSTDYYPFDFVAYVLPAYVVIWLLSIFFSGGYDRPYRISKSIRGVLIGALIISAVYGFLNEAYRFSRAIIVIGTAWAILEVVLTRLLNHFYKYGNLDVDSGEKHNFIIVGSPEESDRVLSLLKQSGVDSNFRGIVGLTGHNRHEKGNYLGDISELQDITDLYEINEVIFCARDVPSTVIIDQISLLGPDKEYKIVPEDSLSIIGSNSKNTAGELYAIDVNLKISQPASRRNKRFFDLILALFLLFTLPFSIFFVRDKKKFIQNIWAVLRGKKTWVSYAPDTSASRFHLPPLRPGILSPMDAAANKKVAAKNIHRLNLQYARDYSVWHDLSILRRHLLRSRT